MVALGQSAYANLQRLLRVAEVAKLGNIRSRGVMTSPPTVTADGSSAPGGQTNGWTRSSFPAMFRESGGLWYPSGSKFKSAVIWTSGGNLGDGLGGQVNYWRFRCLPEANKVTFRLLGTTSAYRFIVDGQYVSLAGTVPAASSGTQYISLDFTSVGGRAVREIAIEGQPGCGIVGVYVGVTEKVHEAPEAPLCSAALGDSYDYGTNATALGDGLDAHMADRLGWNNHMNSGSGGTGWATGGAAYNFLQRIQNGDLALNGAPSVVSLMTSTNDKNSAAASVTANVAAALQLIRTAYPVAPILLFGGFNAASATGTLSMAANENAVQAGIASYNASDPMIQWIPVTNALPGAVLTGSGFVGGTTGTGNADANMFDTSHPNDAGTANFGRWKAEQAYRALSRIAASMA